jgi:Domain of unknown function (DUF1854)
MAADEFDLIADAKGALTLKRPGQEDVAGVRIRRAFPWSNPGRHVSIRSSEGKELLLIEDLAIVPEAQRSLIEKILRESTFIPRVTRILECDTRFGHQNWRVVTDAGPAEFRVQEREDIRFLPDGRFTVKDVDGNLYELPRLADLDEPSRRAVEKLL